MKNREILGYQARCPITELQRIWPQERRALYLLDPFVKLPLSVDRAAWPETDSIEIKHMLFIDHFTDEFSAPNGLDLYSVKESIDEFFNANLIAIDFDKSVAGFLREKNSIAGTKYYSATRFIGYDVCDNNLISGLTNCALSHEEKNLLQLRYAKNLNEYGLFKDDTYAREYTLEMDRLIPEHQPFLVAGLNIVGEIR